MRSLAGVAAALALMACKDSRRPSAPPPASREPREACVDRFLEERGLNPYGDPKDRVYPGGTPLFDERTGEREDRVEHVLKKHPEARRECGEGPERR